MANTSSGMYVLQRGPTALPSGPLDLSFQGPNPSYGSITEGLSRLPADFPNSLRGESTWDSQLDETRYVYNLTGDDLLELNDGLAHFLEKQLYGDLVRRSNFPLPKLGSKLERLSDDLYNGVGLCVIRGLNKDDYSTGDLNIIWLGIQAYIADKRGRQDDEGNMLVHIKADKSSRLSAGHHRHSTSPITFHNEETGDVISWLTRGVPASGGSCVVAPVHSIYNELAAYRPDIIRTLAKSDWPIALPRFQCRPLLFYHESRLMMNFARTPLMGNAVHPRDKDLPTLSQAQVEALDVVEKIARKLELKIKTQAGDMHFINNFTVLHRRDGFSDGAAEQDKRHLVRMRLRSSKLGWSIPDELKEDWDYAFGGYPRLERWNLDPMPHGFYPLQRWTN